MRSEKSPPEPRAGHFAGGAQGMCVRAGLSSRSDPMIVGVLRLELSLPGSDSLKDKRRVLQSLLDRLHQQFNVAAAEIAHQDNRQRAEIAVSCVSNNGVHANRVLSRVLDVVEREADVVLTGVEMELR